MRISDWSSDVCSSDLQGLGVADVGEVGGEAAGLDELRAGAAPALHAEGDDGAAALRHEAAPQRMVGMLRQIGVQHPGHRGLRSEEHTSELQSLMRISYAVFCLKKKRNQHAT